MATTLLTLSDELEKKAASAARELGISPHAFMVDAIQQAADAVDQRRHFVAEAQAAHIAMLESGLGYDAADVRSYLRARLGDQGEQSDAVAVRPTAKPWRA